MGPKFLIDTNIVIYYLEGTLPASGMAFLDTVIDDEPFISVITKIELLGPAIPKKEDVQVIEQFISACSIIHLTENIINQTIQIRRSKKVKIADAIIAASALQHNLTLLTRNVSDFKGIEKLKVKNPFEEDVDPKTSLEQFAL